MSFLMPQELQNIDNWITAQDVRILDLRAELVKSMEKTTEKYEEGYV